MFSYICCFHNDNFNWVLAIGNVVRASTMDPQLSLLVLTFKYFSCFIQELYYLAEFVTYYILQTPFYLQPI